MNTNTSGMKKQALASGDIDVLKLISARVHSEWKRNASDFIQENESKKKRKKRSDDDGFISSSSSQQASINAIQRKVSVNDNKIAQQLGSELEKMRQKCEALERENMVLKVRLAENDKNSSQLSKLEGEKEKLQNEIKGLNQLIGRHERQHNEMQRNLEANLKARQDEIEDLRTQLVSLNGLVLQVDQEIRRRNVLEKENLHLKNVISKVKEIFKKFENKLEKKNNEVVEMMVEWMETHETLSKIQQEEEELKSENNLKTTIIANLTKKLATKRAAYNSQTDSLKILETQLEIKMNDIHSLNQTLEDLHIKHEEKLKKAKKEANQLEMCIQQLKVALQGKENENEEIRGNLAKVECKLKEKQEQLELLLSDHDQFLKFVQKLKQTTRFLGNQDFLANQLEELAVHIKDKVRLMDWCVAELKIDGNGTKKSKLLLRQHN